MANTKAGNGKSLAIETLKADHRKVEALFGRYEEAKEAEDESRRDIAETICTELAIHAAIEEEIFYPWLRDNLEGDEMELVEEAQVEHDGAKALIAQIQGAGTVDAVYDATVKVLSEYVKHHVKEEEQEIFPAVEGEKDLQELGQELDVRRAELKGIEIPTETPPASQAPSRKPNSASSARKGAAR